MADLTSLLSRFLSNLPKFSGGVSGALTVNTTQAGTTAVTTEEDLWTYSLPANTLSADGKAIRITAWGSWANNANAKTVRVYFGGTAVVAPSGTAANSAWRATMTVVRTGASAQLAEGSGQVGSTMFISGVSVTPAGDTTGAITIKVTGQNGTASANDVVFRGAVVELLN